MSSFNLPKLAFIATSQAVAWLTHFSLSGLSIARRAASLKLAFPSQNQRNAWLSSNSLIACNLQNAPKADQNLALTKFCPQGVRTAVEVPRYPLVPLWPPL